MIERQAASGYARAMDRPAMRRPSKIEVELGELQESAEARVRSGQFGSLNEVVRAGLLALDRDDANRNEAMRRAIEEALADPRPSIPADEVFAGLRARHAERVQAVKRGP